MPHETPQGRRFSQLYLRPESLTSDGPRLRRRLIGAFQDVIDRRALEFGTHLERELGIKVMGSGSMSAYVLWDKLGEGELRDILDTITLLGHYLRAQRMTSEVRFLTAVRRILSEESASYRIDPDFGVHPAVDGAYQANVEAAIRSLAPANFLAARGHIEKADKQLLPAGDTREAIRAAFDAVENIFRQQFSRAPHINRGSIQSDLRPLVDRLYADGVEKRTAAKMVDALSDWVDACHNYRHEPGHPEPTPPSEDLAVLLVSQGFSYARWLADLMQMGKVRSKVEAVEPSFPALKFSAHKPETLG